MDHSVSEAPRRRCLSVEDYYRMADVGILGADERVELVAGEIFVMPPPGSLHAGTVDQLAAALQAATGTRAIVRVQNPIRLGRYSEPQPDLALVRPRRDFYKSAHPVANDVLLIVEVAHSSLAFDRDVKAALYARHGIPELWLLDLAAAELVRYQVPRAGGYQRLERPLLDQPLALAALPGVRVDLPGLFAS